MCCFKLLKFGVVCYSAIDNFSRLNDGPQKYVHILIPRTCELYGKDFEDVIKNLGMGDGGGGILDYPAGP